jgi:hypothetical protein
VESGPSRGIGLLIKISSKINLPIDIAAGRRFMPPLTITPHQFDSLLFHSNYLKVNDSNITDELAFITDTSNKLSSCMVCGDGTNAGELVQCKKCVRVVHPVCINDYAIPSSDANNIDWICLVCVERENEQQPQPQQQQRRTIKKRKQASTVDKDEME